MIQYKRAIYSINYSGTSKIEVSFSKQTTNYRHWMPMHEKQGGDAMNEIEMKPHCPQ